MNRNLPGNMRVLLNDDLIVVVDKPPDVLSVPGRVNRVDDHFIPRNIQWMQSISELLLTYSRHENQDSPLMIAVQKLFEGKHTVPRQKSKFHRYLARVAKISDEAVINKIWLDLEQIDQYLHRFDSTSLPPALFSAADHAEAIAGTRIFHVHRLDQETSGVLMFAKTSEAAGDICRQFRERKIRKIYLAKVLGTVVDQDGIINMPIAVDVENPPKQKIDYEYGKHSLTRFRVVREGSVQWEIAKFHFSCVHVDADTTLLELNPETGRTHQLRIHLSAVGHPIIGDSLYFDEKVYGRVSSNRLCLHAFQIEFRHPLSNDTVVVSSD